jgi:uncharacterized membrane protein
MDRRLGTIVDSFVTLALLLVAVGVGIAIIYWVRSRFREDSDPAASDHAMLSHLGELHREGDLSEEEYRSIKGLLIGRLDESPRRRPDSE